MTEFSNFSVAFVPRRKEMCNLFQHGSWVEM